MYMSRKVLVDIMFNEKLDNPTTCVGRREVIGSTSKQMRHVTPYAFIELSIKNKVISSSSKNNCANLLGRILFKSLSALL